MGKVSSKEKMRRFSSPRFINIDINRIILNSISSSSFNNPKIISGVLRFDTFHGDGDVRIPSYKMMVLIDDSVYCYNKLSKRNKIVLDNYCEIIKFTDSIESSEIWSKYIKNKIVSYVRSATEDGIVR